MSPARASEWVVRSECRAEPVDECRRRAADEARQGAVGRRQHALADAVVEARDELRDELEGRDGTAVGREARTGEEAVLGAADDPLAIIGVTIYVVFLLVEAGKWVIRKVFDRR